MFKIGLTEITPGYTVSYNGTELKQIDVKSNPSASPVTVWKKSGLIVDFTISANNAALHIKVGSLEEIVLTADTVEEIDGYNVGDTLEIYTMISGEKSTMVNTTLDDNFHYYKITPDEVTITLSVKCTYTRNTSSFIKSAQWHYEFDDNPIIYKSIFISQYNDVNNSLIIQPSYNLNDNKWTAYVSAMSGGDIPPANGYCSFNTRLISNTGGYGDFNVSGSGSYTVDKDVTLSYYKVEES